MPSELPLASDAGAVPAEQRGRERLKGAFLIELDRLRPDPNQPRRVLQDEALQEMAASIRCLGVVQPISVRYIASDDVYQIISGHRRYEAAKRADLTAIPCIIHDPAENQVLVHQIVENWQRAQLHPFEIADALAKLRDQSHLSQKQLARETGKPEVEISKLLSLLDLAPSVQQAARQDASGALSLRHLYNIARLPTDEQVPMAAAVREQRLSAIETEKLVQQSIRRTTTKAKRGSPVTKVEFATAKAKVILTFRRQAVETSDILAALDEARNLAAGANPKLNIIRAK